MAVLNRPITRSLGSLMPEVLFPEELINLKISGLCLDSRLVESGDLFIAVPGFSHDGRDHIQSSLKAGAEVVLAHAVPVAHAPRLEVCLHFLQPPVRRPSPIPTSRCL